MLLDFLDPIVRLDADHAAGRGQLAYPTELTVRTRRRLGGGDSKSGSCLPLTERAIWTYYRALGLG